MSLSPYASAGPKLVSMGYAAIPIMPGAKMPGVYASGQWFLQRGWNQFCSELPPSFQVGLWSKWPDAGLGVACGNGLIVIDIDRDGAIKDDILAVLPPANVAKRGRKGVSLFYRGNTDRIRSRNFKIDKQGVVDLLAWGKQTVLPPTVHPDTHEPYYWLTERALDNTPHAGLVEIGDADVAGLIEVLRRYGYQEEKTFDFLSEPIADGDAATIDFFRGLNEDALNNLDAWVPKLGLPKTRREGTRWRAVASWRGSNSGRSAERRNPNLSFHRSGIEDFGDSTKYTAINAVMRALQIPDESDAAVWLGNAIGYRFDEPIINLRPTAHIQRERPAPAAEAEPPVEPEERPSSLPATVAAPEPPVAAPEPPESPETDEEEDRVEAAPSMRELEALTFIPGLVGEIVDWIVGCSDKPSRALALGPALCWVGTLAGRLHAGPTDLRTNLYVVALAPPGFGKDHARKCVDKIAIDSGLDHRFLGAARFMSTSAIRAQLDHKPSSYSQIDEFGGFMNQILDRKAGSHQSGMRQDLLEYYSTSAGRFGGAQYAQTQATPIYNPCLSIYGTSTPADFWPAMSQKGISDGFLPRWLVINVSGDEPEFVRPRLSKREVPPRIIEGSRAIVTLSHSGNMPPSADKPVDPRFAEWGEGGEEAYFEWRAYCARMQKTCLPEGREMWGRTAEIALKLAHIVAIGVDVERPTIYEETMEWAVKLAIFSTQTAIAEMSDRLAANDRQAEYLEVKRMVREAGSKGITPRTLFRRINGKIDERRLESILKQLDRSGDIFGEIGVTGPRGGAPGYRYFALRRRAA